MSYTRSFTKQIAVHYSGSVNTKGGSVPYSGVKYENVTVNVKVDTVPFDHSIGHCNNQVGFLTGAVVATEQAQVAAIQENAMTVGQTIVNGFFKTVRYEIGEQIVELRNRIDALIMHLNELAKRCVAKQDQMERDYNRLTTRYLKIFDDLNGELKNRIYELDRPTFNFKQDSDRSSYRAMNDDMVGVATVFNEESGHLQATISASVVKNKVQKALGIAKSFLLKQKQTEAVLHHCILNDANNAVYYAPVCYIETFNEGERLEKGIYRAPLVTQSTDDELIQTISSKPIPPQSKENIRIHLNQELTSHYTSANAHDERVRKYITALFNKNTILQ